MSSSYQTSDISLIDFNFIVAGAPSAEDEEAILNKLEEEGAIKILFYQIGGREQNPV